MNDEFGKDLEGSDSGLFEVIHRDLPGWTEESHEIPSGIADVTTDI
jgi:hypothetical protein